MANVAISIEPFSLELAGEIRPLGQKCWDESTTLKGDTCAFHGERDFIIEPDMDQYQLFAKQNSLLIVTVRDQGRLRGYAIGVLYKSLHHKNIMVGGADSCYVEPEYRSYTAVLVEKFEEGLKARGAVTMGWLTNQNGPLHAVLKARGYVGDETMMEKRLCAS